MITGQSRISQTFFVIFVREISGVTSSPINIHGLAYSTTTGAKSCSVNLKTTVATVFISAFGAAT